MTTTRPRARAALICAFGAVFLPFVLFMLFVGLLAAPADAANRYDPRLKFRTISTPRFEIYFHQREEALARRLARIVEDVADALGGGLGTPSGRVHVILVDQTDLSNGWATPVPHNVIELNTVAPPGESSIGNTDDWLRLVFSHEYTHIVHLDKARGWIGGLRGVFGRVPLLYPNLFLPLWQIEGIATYEESRLTGAGRVPAGDFRMVVDRAAAAGSFAPLNRANGGLVDWPAGAAQYAYGAYFHQYLSDRYGPASLVRLAGETSGRVPYFGAPAFRRVFGRSLGDLWDDFEKDSAKAARSRQPDEPSARTRLTHHGFSVRAPRFSPGGRLFYSMVNPHGFPALMELPPGGAPPRQIATRYLGGRMGASRDLLVFDQMEIVRNVGLQSDIYSVAQEGGPARRLTREARAADPDLSPDGQTIVCTIQAADRRSLATLAMPSLSSLSSTTGMSGTPGEPVTLVSEPFTDYSSPRWSPDGRMILAERRRVGGPSEIVLVDAATREVRPVVSSAQGRNVGPSWLPTGDAFLFASDRDGGPFAIYRTDASTGATTRLAGAGLGAQSPEVSPDGRQLVFVGYNVEGFDLFAMPLASAVWTAVPPSPVLQPDLAEKITAPASAIDTTPLGENYQPLRTVLPRFWTPVVESDNGELVAGAGTGGFDILGRHTYGATLTWSGSRARPDWRAGYVYDRWWPTLYASVSDDTDPWRDGELRSLEVNAGAVFPFRRVRWNQTVLAAFHGSSDAFECADCAPSVDTTVARRSLRFGWSFDNSKSYGYSISREQGAAVSMTVEATRRALGADGDGGAATMALRGYHRAFPRHGVIAARLAGASAWGDARARRRFSAAGAGPQPGGFDFGSRAIGLLRGFEEGDVAGNHAVVANLEYRVPLARIQRGIGTLPFFFRTAHGALFADVGHAWDDEFRAADRRMSLGAELSLDGVVGYVLPLTFTAGAAWRFDGADLAVNPTGGNLRRGIVAFARIGRAF